MGKVIMDKKLILLFLLFLTTLTCSTKTEKPIPEQKLEGWAGNPDNPNEKPFDYFYMRSTGGMPKKGWSGYDSVIAIRYTCIENARNNGERELIRKMLNESLKKFCILCISLDMENLKSILFYDYSSRIKQDIKVCRPLAASELKIPLREGKECECIIYAHIPGGKDGIIARAKEIEKE
ncbi:MAG: hypothetical protein IPG24_15870 [Leptospiraceae bacterium]|nr:hypothetical protein [Leptospiraceae bacterium]